MRQNRLRALIERHKVVALFAPSVLLVVLTRVLPASDVQLYALLLTLPIAVVFIGAYLPERPGREWFGASLLVLAYAVVAVGVVAALVRLLGPQAWYQHLVNLWIGLTFSALLARTWVLLAGQWDERRHLGGWLRGSRGAEDSDDQGVR